LESELPSQVVAALEPLSLEALAAAYVLRPALRARLSEYLARWRFIEAELNGDDLLALGLPPGPNFARWLRGLRAARLDGRVSDRDGELSLLRAWSQME
jgi:tRNA nucleotidyltransferase (CCA-adding enzyme)